MKNDAENERDKQSEGPIVIKHECGMRFWSL